MLKQLAYCILSMRNVLFVCLQAYLRQYGYLNDPADHQDPHYLEGIIEALR